MERTLELDVIDASCTQRRASSAVPRNVSIEMDGDGDASFI